MATVCLTANTIGYPNGGGHLWVYLNWALGLAANGCKVIWLEFADPRSLGSELAPRIRDLAEKLEPFGLRASLALAGFDGGALDLTGAPACLDLDAACEADLLLNQIYALHPAVLGRFRRTALLDIDPGLTQLWMAEGSMSVAPHDLYFSIGETVGGRDALIPDAGLDWIYTPPCVSLEWWPQAASVDGRFTTVTHWSTHEHVRGAGGFYNNSKRAGFLKCIALPQHTTVPLELAVLLGPYDQEDKRLLEAHGWRLVDSHEVAGRPADYQAYIQRSRGEFSCVKPSCVRLQNAWISDRTLCYLASGKPAVVEHTGPSRFLPDLDGLLRFRDEQEAVSCLEAAASDYARHSRAAVRLVEEYFNARTVTAKVLERAL